METIKMTYVNIDGQEIEKDIEKRLVSTYISMGWKTKKEKPIYDKKEEKSFSTFKKNK